MEARFGGVLVYLCPGPRVIFLKINELSLEVLEARTDIVLETPCPFGSPSLRVIEDMSSRQGGSTSRRIVCRRVVYGVYLNRISRQEPKFDRRLWKEFGYKIALSRVHVWSQIYVTQCGASVGWLMCCERGWFKRGFSCSASRDPAIYQNKEYSYILMHWIPRNTGGNFLCSSVVLPGAPDM
ncbi:hypothetical protein P167DRAFT_550485 [Morchella conica CCBAS932]|uniref:Uncharacterized protein n=1 Tax=Morchella conica CCBAS932 TaxID=1392247 RepID=A0A3N4KAX5_9PEZI|nr:hypothetical protein P167DRAFT_550485 [Morchella conica CCBAS932]